ncbi:MAG: putative peptidoglycan binding domain-containing protein [Deltaproteobacteria bacterium]
MILEWASMERVLGLIVVGAGLAYFATEYAPAALDHEEQAAEISRIVARATILEPETVPAEHPDLRRPVISPAAASAIAPALPPRDLLADRTGNALPTVVVANERQVLPAAASPKSDLDVQRQLARQIQAELKRVGCYSGRLDGSWGERSRRAMETFVSRVNASLPTREPDVFLLSLVKGQTGDVCGQACDNGYMSRGGRCVAGEILADAGSRTPSSAPEFQVAARPTPLPGRMSIGGPLPDDAANGPVTGSPSPAGERLPWQTETQPPSSPPTEAVAALSPDQVPGDDIATAAAPPRKAARTKKSWNAPRQGPAKRTYNSARSVQLMFMHPLGRM